MGNINLSTTQTRLYPCLGLLGNHQKTYTAWTQKIHQSCKFIFRKYNRGRRFAPPPVLLLFNSFANLVYFLGPACVCFLVIRFPSRPRHGYNLVCVVLISHSSAPRKLGYTHAFWVIFGTFSEHFLGHFFVIFRTFSGHFRNIFGTFSERFWIIFGTFSEHFS